jgi:hypothetical protein
VTPPKILFIAILGIVHHCFAFEIISKDSATPIYAVPYTISSPGIYYLANNIFSTANAKITISASNVVLDLGGHTLQTSSEDEVILVSGGSGPKVFEYGGGSFNVTVQNGTLVNNVAGCFVLGGHACVIDHVTMISNGLCTLYDEGGISNRISNCVFASGTSWEPPIGPHGEFGATVVLLGCGDLFENNMVYGDVGSSNTGAVASTLGNVFRNNVVWSPPPSPSVPPGNGIGTDQYDVSVGNLLPGGTPP